MPELPEVEMYARYFERHALGQKIAGVRVLDARICGTRKLNQLVGRKFKSVQRHGKHLFADAGDLWLHIHFGMSGDLAYYHDQPPRFARLVFDFNNRTHMAYEDMRLFGVVEQGILGRCLIQVDLAEEGAFGVVEMPALRLNLSARFA